MRICIIFLIGYIFITTSCTPVAERVSSSVKKLADYDLSMYPKASDTLYRYIIELPTEKNERLYNLEIWAGKTQKVDCNKHRLMGEFTKKSVQGWGYYYYEFKTDGLIMSTKMGCPMNKKTEKFIRSKPEHVPYNSKLPIVVYCPKNIALEYAIWSKGTTPKKAKLK
jgi:ecotin